LDRRAFFKKALLPKKEGIYPPYYEKEEDFEKCIECEEKDCLRACPEAIIEIKENKPVLNFRKSGCSYCNRCAEVCLKDVLRVESRRRIDADFLISSVKCLAWNGVMCYNCFDSCEERAIVYYGVFKPQIKKDRCTGCGFCVAVCPSDAIKISKR